MPWKVFTEGDKHCVYKLDAEGEKTGKSLGCHDKEDEASAQVKALYANEKKELPELDTKGVTSLAELEQARIARAQISKVRQTVWDMEEVIDNIVYDKEVVDKAGAITRLIDEFKATVTSALSSAASAVKSALHPTPEPPPQQPEPEPPHVMSDMLKEGGQPFMVWKDANGQWLWVARYSNSFRDNDWPPEIISSKSHRRFVEMVDKGTYPMPELWLWHEPSWKWGEARFVAFNEVTKEEFARLYPDRQWHDGMGFAWAAGTVDPGMEWVAESFASQNKSSVLTLVSHGMPIESIVRDPVDKTVYLEHQTKEISPLPATVAANKLTGFQVILSKETHMALSDKKIEEAAALLGVPKEQVANWTNRDAADAAAAKQAGVQSKEVNEPTPEPTPTTPPAAQPAYVTQAEFKEATDQIVSGVTDSIKAVLEAVESLKKEVAQTAQAQADKQAAQTPAASIYDRLTSVVGRPETVADGRTKEAKTQPEQNQDKSGGSTRQGGTGISLIDELVTGSRQRAIPVNALNMQVARQVLNGVPGVTQNGGDE